LFCPRQHQVKKPPLRRRKTSNLRAYARQVQVIDFLETSSMGRHERETLTSDGRFRMHWEIDAIVAGLDRGVNVDAIVQVGGSYPDNPHSDAPWG
jgi:hypothetical protein